MLNVHRVKLRTEAQLGNLIIKLGFFEPKINIK